MTSTDKLELYRWAVQDPETHAVVLQTMYETTRSSREPVVLREDFAGTSAESVAWVALHRGRRSVAVDRDGPTLEWARRRAVRLLGGRAAVVQFVEGDTRTVGPPEVPAADIIAVLNYSIFLLHTDGELVYYLRRACLGLETDGILVLNLFGGEPSVQVGTSRRHVNPNPRLPIELAPAEFEYEWEVRSYDPDSRRVDCRIHFILADPAAPDRPLVWRDVFQYDFRVWSVAEILEACAQAGFADQQVWRHTYNPAQGAAGVFLGEVEPESLLPRDTWSAYIVACR